MNKTILKTASALGLLAVIFGALGAHALKSQINSEALNSFQTGVQYQMYHALFLLFLGILKSIPDLWRKRIFNMVFAGVLLFSGSIYMLSTSEITGINFKPFGWITPIGGFLLIMGWSLLLYWGATAEPSKTKETVNQAP
ncbi:MAG: hypothetical protein RLZZ241_1484 [Bacteroidota bacterium]|jgi:uncharacterized membrane protein YgdD (TMEM256/DUF423 family)